MGIKFGLNQEKQKQIPEEFKDLAKDFAEKGFITTVNITRLSDLAQPSSRQILITLLVELALLTSRTEEFISFFTTTEFHLLSSFQFVNYKRFFIFCWL